MELNFMNKLKALVILLTVCAGISPAMAQVGGLDGTRLEELSVELNLSEIQRKKVKTLLTRYATEASSVREGLIQVQQTIQSANLARLNSSTIQRISGEAGRLSSAHTKSLLTTQRDFYALLSKEQKQQYNKMRAEAQAKQLRLPALPDKR
jgi:hypothetical protein